MLEGDKSSGYIRGCVVKQGTLGQYYLKQGELKSAERVFESCLTFVRSRNEALFDGLHWNKDEAEAAEQIALFNMANLFAQQQLSPDLIEGALVEALYRPSSMHLQTSRKILTELIELLKKHSRDYEMDELMQLEAKYSIKATVSNAQKRVMFAIDYSGSMSGEKIRSAVENVRNIFTTYVDDHDHIGLLRFNHRSDVLLGLTMKGGNEQLIDASFDQLLSPSGGTRLYNAIDMAYHQFGDAKSGAYKQSNDWVVVLTDGRNNDCCCFQTTMAALKSSINKSPVKLIVIGVGNDVHTDVLTDIANSASKGIYLFATEDQASITEAFGKVAQLIIQEQILIEEY